MDQLKSQLFGLLLATATAVGCIAYEHIVKEYSFLTFVIILMIEIICLFIVGWLVFPNELVQDFTKLQQNWQHIIWILTYILTGVTSICWYMITRNQGVMVGSLYEVKYVVILALIYIFFGENKFTTNTAIGLALALCSIYFISKQN